MNISHLPIDVLGIVVNYLNEVTGSPALQNKADIRVVAKYVNALGYTCKRLYQNVHGDQITEILLKSLEKKYKISFEEIAVRTNTSGTRKWVWRKYHVYYQDVLEIFALKSRLLNINDRSIEFESGYYEGFILNCRGFNPASISTPLGQINVTPRIEESFACAYAEIFIKELDAVLDNFYVCSEKPVYEYLTPNNSTLGKIHERECKEIKGEIKKGTQNLIFQLGGRNKSQYRIRKIGNRLIPTSKTTLLSNEFTKYAWNLFENQVVIKDKTEIFFNSISEILDWGVNIIERLNASPLVPVNEIQGTKTLSLKNSEEAAGFVKLNDAARSNRIILANNQWLEFKFWVGIHYFELETVKKNYQDVLNLLTKNWERCSLKDHLSLIDTYSEEEYFLYFNKTCILANCDLLLFISRQLGISEFAHFAITKQNYHFLMWIRKDKLEQVTTALKLNFI